jgi:hypothetical protein
MADSKAYRLLIEMVGESMKKLHVLLLAGIPLVVAVVAWRMSSEEAAVAVAAPRPLQLNVPKASPPARSVAARPVAARPAAARPAAASPAPASATRKNAAAATAAKKTPNGETPDDYVYVPAQKSRRTAPSVAAIAPRTTGASSSGSARVAPAAPYERSVAEAVALGGEDSDRAARRLEQLTADAPDRPQAYEALAAIRLRQGDYYQAQELFDSALRHGGKATFSIMHDHTRGNFESEPDATCAGDLILTPTEVRFEGVDGHRIAASWTEVLETGANKFFGSGIGGFHVKVAVAKGKTKNFNLAPRSRDKREANLILELLIENARRHDTAK